MTVVIKRMSTEYSDREDRLRLSGEVEGAGPVVIWLTQRLAARLLPVLLKYLDKQTNGRPQRDALHDFAQQAARADLKPQAPVQAEPGAESLLAHKVDVIHGKGRVTLVFGDEAPRARFTLTTKQLHQWLAILHRRWAQAQWGPAPWPDWIAPATKSGKPKTTMH